MPVEKTKKTKAEKEIQEKELDVQELIKKAVEDALKKQAKEFEKKVDKAPKKSKYKIIPDNSKIKIKSNITGEFNWFEDKAKTNVLIQMYGAGQEQLLDYDELRILATKDFLRRGVLAIVDVYSEDNDLEILDVAKDINIGKLYEGDIQVNNLEVLFTEEVDINKFTKYINDNKEVAETVLDVAYRLYRQGQFNDHAKMSFLRTGFNNPNLFK